MNFIPENKEIITIQKVREMSPLVLAYIGDAVHSLYSREKYALSTTYKPNKLHILVSNEVKAKAQAEKLEKIFESLSQDEKDIFMRARNTHVNTIAKNASKGEYLEATGFEALIGYLYLTGQNERLKEILENE
ncbi:MAG: Mini-ribonuclease 3 [Clostridia bacterium]|nr:Mini-ribonuclease 3 [Clostridia bacterium]